MPISRHTISLRALRARPAAAASPAPPPACRPYARASPRRPWPRPAAPGQCGATAQPVPLRIRAPRRRGELRLLVRRQPCRRTWRAADGRAPRTHRHRNDEPSPKASADPCRRSSQSSCGPPLKNPRNGQHPPRPRPLPAVAPASGPSVRSRRPSKPACRRRQRIKPLRLVNRARVTSTRHWCQGPGGGLPWRGCPADPLLPR